MSIVTELSDRILRVEIRRPDKKNALTAQMYDALADAIERADADAQVRAVLIHGQADCFTAGNDLRDFLENPPSGEDSGAFRFLRALRVAAKPLVAAVAGPAVGIGTTLLLHCELVYAASNARFALPFASLGLCPEGGSSLLLAPLVGYPRAAELLLLGEPFGADKAQEMGLVNDVFPPERLLDEARARAAKLAALPPASLRATKSLMKQALAPQLAEAMAREVSIFRERLASPEAKEAFAAFLEKRKPDFSRFD